MNPLSYMAARCMIWPIIFALWNRAHSLQKDKNVPNQNYYPKSENQRKVWLSNLDLCFLTYICCYFERFKCYFYLKFLDKPRRLLAKETKNAFLFNFSQENSFQLFANKKIFHFDFFVSPDSIRESASVLIGRDTRGAFLHFVRCRPSNLSNEGQRSFSISS